MPILQRFGVVSSLIRRCFGSLGAPGLSSSRKVQERQIKRPATDVGRCAQIWVELGDDSKSSVIPPWCGVIPRRCAIIPHQRGNSADFAAFRRCFVVDSALFWLLGGAGIGLEPKGVRAPDQKACYRRWALRSNCVELGDDSKSSVIPPWCGVIPRRCAIIPRQRGNSADFAGIRRCFDAVSTLFRRCFGTLEGPRSVLEQ